MLAKSAAWLAIAFLLVSCFSCTSQPAVSTEPPTGRWSGDYEVSSGRRESISVELRWDDANLRGEVHSGFRSLPITKASFQRDTGAIALEFDAEGPGGRTVHYVIEGKVAGNTMTGTWTHDNQRGDFRVTKQ
jgi:hypothetical protein